MNSGVTSALPLPLRALSSASPSSRTAGVVSSATAQGLYTIKTDDGSVVTARSLTGNISAGTRIWLVAVAEPYIYPQSSESEQLASDRYVPVGSGNNLQTLVDVLRQAISADTVSSQLVDAIKATVLQDRDPIAAKTDVVKLLDAAQKEIAQNASSPDAKMAAIALLSALEKMTSAPGGTLGMPIAGDVASRSTGVYIVKTPAELVQLLQNLKIDAQQIKDFLQQVSTQLPGIARVSIDGSEAKISVQSEKMAASGILAESALSWSGALTADDIIAIVTLQKAIPQKRIDILAQLAAEYPLQTEKTADPLAVQVVRQVASTVLSADLSERAAATLDPSGKAVSFIHDVVSLSEQNPMAQLASTVKEYSFVSTVSDGNVPDLKALACVLGMTLEHDAASHMTTMSSVKKELLLLSSNAAAKSLAHSEESTLLEMPQTLAETRDQSRARVPLQTPSIAASARAIAQMLLEAVVPSVQVKVAFSFENVRATIVQAQEQITTLVKQLEAPSVDTHEVRSATLPNANTQIADVLGLKTAVLEKQGDHAQRARFYFAAALKALESCEAIITDAKTDTMKVVVRKEMIANLVHEAAKYLANIDSLGSSAWPRTSGALIEKTLSQLENLQLAARATTTADGQQSILSLPVLVDGRWTELRVTVRTKKDSKKKSTARNKCSIRIDTQLDQTGRVSAQLEYQEKQPLLVKVVAEHKGMLTALRASEDSFRAHMREKGFGNLAVVIAEEQKHAGTSAKRTIPVGLVDVQG